MPEKILDLLKKEKLTEGQIAERLQVSIAEIKACMEYLQQMHFIQSTAINPTGGGCNGGCGGNCGNNCNKCDSSTNHISGSGYVLWEIL